MLGDDIKTGLMEVVCEGVDWIHLAPVAGSKHSNSTSGPINYFH
jgi:hypothetical protein